MSHLLRHKLKLVFTSWAQQKTVKGGNPAKGACSCLYILPTAYQGTNRSLAQIFLQLLQKQINLPCVTQKH